MKLYQVCMHACADIISSVPFFEDAEEGFTTSLVTCLTPQVCLKGDFVIREGEVSREMYFIKAGSVQVEYRTKGEMILRRTVAEVPYGVLRESFIHWLSHKIPLSGW